VRGMVENLRFSTRDLGFGIWDLVGLRPIWSTFNLKFKNGVVK